MDDLSQSIAQSAELDLKLVQAKHVAELIYQEERARILRVSLLLQEDASDELQEQLEAQEDALHRSESLNEGLQTRLDEMQEQYQAAQDELRACIRDVSQYQTELNALNAAAAENNKQLNEKLALTRELHNLRPELDHLRSVVASQENFLADKLSLQRELTAAQLELENEKRTIERLRQKQQNSTPDPAIQEELQETKRELSEANKRMSRLEKQNTKLTSIKPAADAALVDAIESLKAELETTKQRAAQAESALQTAQSTTTNTTPATEMFQTLKADLAKEKRAHSRTQREHLKKQTEWDTEKTALDTKLDAFRNKLRSTKEQLKEAQDELERREQAKYAQSTAATKARMTGRASSVQPEHAQTAAQEQQNPRKRNVARFDPDMTIGTPGNGGVANKKARLTHGSTTILADKSTFSITPFLNRTMSILPESPGQIIEDTINEIVEEADRAIAEKEDKAKTAEKTAKAVEVKEKGKPATDARKPNPKEKKPTQPQPLKDRSNASTTHTGAKAPALDSVVEEDADEDADQQEQNPPKPVVEVQPQPKKKKLLGTRKNIFDADEPDGLKKAAGITAGGGALGRAKLGLGRNKMNTNNKPRLLAEFSPLKKDRRSMSVLQPSFEV
ncbi:hypothetical protein LTS08_003460 [Lithohypha guttulata]|nr:hypothetical protein LTS08_003460 [Lithohypha guttulata]